VQQGTLASQRVVTGTLASLPGRVEKANLHAPTLIIVGNVVRLRDKLNWFKPKM
jgi:uroporphyrin-III C-methyltransferase/precorrin-2 dehydrogenase/sirohydrochlorin ferrochelatase